ncbi:MAG: lamin tail domain-containing protein, partial [Ancrocorticia sp.]|uniref:lamin tail domain-containing protein n=1 Tax=Ancrocorticia sp. TaxID=2593684 RepID=UPI003F91889C
MNRKKVRPVALAAATAMLMTPLVAMPAAATPEGDNVVINEVSVDQLYAELYNPSDDEVALDGLSFAYYAQKGGHQNGTVALSGTMEPNGYYLVGLRQTGSTSGVETDVDWDATSQVGANGGYAIVKSDSDYVNLANGDVAGDEALIDFYGVGNSVKFETQASPAKPTASQSAGRTDGVDTDNNAADFSPQTPTPTNSNGETAEPGEPDPEPTDPGDPDPEPTEPGESVDPDEITPIADIQGPSANSPLAGQTVTTQGYVTATYPTGGKNGIYIQSASTGGTTSHGAPSEAVFVYDGSAALPNGVQIGDFVQVKGLVNEFNGSTQITVADKGWSTIEPVGEKPEAVSMDRLPADEVGKEALEGMLVDFTGPITVTDNYQNGVNYGEIGVAFGDKPLRQPSDVYNPTRDGHAALEGIDQDNAERLITIDDGRTTNWSGADNKNSVPLPYISNTAPVRTGAEVELVQPAVVEYSFNKWRLQPVEPATTEDGNVGDQFFAFENDRPDAPAEVGGDVTLSGFNVLNYFTTTAADVNCTSTYKDRQGNPITANSCNTVRGAADGVNLARQQVKIVSAINTLDSDVVSLEEIENSAKNNKDRDAALETLTDALNAADSSKNW